VQVKNFVYRYKVKVFDPCKKSEYIVRQLHKFKEKACSIAHLKQALMIELGNDVPREVVKCKMGYFEGRHQTKRWLACEDDLKLMYDKFKMPGSEIFLWCNGREVQDNTKGKSQVNNKRQAREEELDSIFKELKEKHDTYSGPQLRLWARMIASGTHDSFDEPPRVPMILGAPLPKRPKPQESMSTALIGAATAFAKVLSPSPPSCGTPEKVSHSSIKISPGKTADIRMKNLEQLRYLQQLMEDGILSQKEFLEQKEIIMGALRNLQ